ncbi:MAG: Tim44 domain-containing protein [Coriobacteriales bacterium]|jgi:hypothetical protein|nr:Tim44 domain-containing protein [Coriobacteriales bacterium]
MEVILIPLAVFAGVLVAAGLTVLYIRQKIRSYIPNAAVLLSLRGLLGNAFQSSVATAELPRSLAGAERIYVPQISRDFPQFNLAEFITKSENMILSVFNAIEAGDVRRIVNASQDLRDRVQAQIDDNIMAGRREFFDDARIHDTVLKGYDRRDGRCVVTLQSALAFRHYLQSADGQLLQGDRQRLIQTRCTTQIQYIQDLEKVSEITLENAIAVTCPQCGAAITNLGNKSCDYCHSAIIEVNVKVWAINSYQLQDLY